MPEVRHKYKCMRKFAKAVATNARVRKELTGADIMGITAPCQGRCKVRDELDIPKHVQMKDDDLFLLQLEIIDLLKPKRIFSEMTPPNKDHFQDHAAVARSIEDLGYEVEVTDEFPADLCGDYQGRKRWILIGRRKNGQLKPFKMFDKLQRLPKPLNDILDAPEDIDDSRWVASRSSTPIFRKHLFSPILIQSSHIWTYPKV